EHALRQREHQNQDRARARPETHGKNRTETAPPAARTGEFAWNRAMRMAAMLVVDVIMVMGVIVPVVIVTMLMAAMGHMGVRMRMLVVMMVVSVAGMVVGRRCDERHRRQRLRRLQRANESAALSPDQPGAKGCDQGVACDLDHLFGPAHGAGGGVEQPGAGPDDCDRDQRLHQR